MKLFGVLPVALLVILLAGAVWGKFAPRFDSGTCDGQVDYRLTHGRNSSKLYVVAPGLNATAKEQQRHWRTISGLLLEDGDVALFSYPISTWSNADPSAIARQVNLLVQRLSDQYKYEEIVLIGYSMGAPIARKALLYSAARADDKSKQRAATSVDAWHTRVQRMVLLAGMNRGWDLSTQRPADMRWHRQAWYAFGIWLGNFLHRGQVVIQMQVGMPFVADLRVEWMHWMKELSKQAEPRTVQVVQLLGDIDDLVTPEDTKDLQVVDNNNFAWLKVRGTGHAEILDMQPPQNHQVDTIQNYRYRKLRDAVTLDFKTLRDRSEVLSPPKNESIERVVFIVHGIRDLGEWSSEFETALQRQLNEVGDKKRLAIASVRYGYFGMGQFLLRRDREKYVRWFMDQYTETLASYPKAKEIHFIGHSNGTYLLASALEKYRALRIDKLVLAGSVVRKDYDWSAIFRNQQVGQVRNYVAQDDLVVALFPRFFETWPVILLDNDVGSAGFNGFQAKHKDTGLPLVDNIEYISGGHDAFMNHVGPIAEFLMPTPAQAIKQAEEALVRRQTPDTRTSQFLKFYSDHLTWTLWALIIFVVLWLGARMWWAAGPHGAIALIAYVLIVLQVLRWI